VLFKYLIGLTALKKKVGDVHGTKAYLAQNEANAKSCFGGQQKHVFSAEVSVRTKKLPPRNHPTLK
jgi:hypothetical protein